MTTAVERAIRVPSGALSLDGDLALPVSPRGLVLFAHGGGSGRMSTRDRFVAAQLQRAGIGTLLLDLLTPSEARIDRQTAHFRFNIALLAERVEQSARWLMRQPETRRLPLGLFGSNTGSAATIVGAAGIPDAIAAIVSRGGRPDLAGPALMTVRAPSLFIVGGADAHVRRMNEDAIEQLNCPSELQVIDGASSLFEEAGALERVAELATAWFRRWMPSARRTPIPGKAPAAVRG